MNTPGLYGRLRACSLLKVQILLSVLQLFGTCRLASLLSVTGALDGETIRKSTHCRPQKPQCRAFSQSKLVVGVCAAAIHKAAISP